MLYDEDYAYEFNLVFFCGRHEGMDQRNVWSEQIIRRSRNIQHSLLHQRGQQLCSRVNNFFHDILSSILYHCTPLGVSHDQIMSILIKTWEELHYLFRAKRKQHNILNQHRFTVMMLKQHKKMMILFQQPMPQYLVGSFLLKIWTILYLSCKAQMP